MYLHTIPKNELYRSRLSKIWALQTDTQTATAIATATANRCGQNITTPHYADGN